MEAAKAAAPSSALVLLPSEAVAVAPRRTSNAPAVVGLVAAALALFPGVGVPFSIVGAVTSALGIRRASDALFRRTAVVALTLSATALAAQVFLFFLVCWLRLDRRPRLAAPPRDAGAGMIPA